MSNEDIYTKIARLRTRRTMSHFATASDYKIHGEGYREAVSDMAELAHQEVRLDASVASAAPSGEREKFEVWVAARLRESFPYAPDEDIQAYLIRRLNEPETYLHYDQGWKAWQAAIAHQPPKEAPAVNAQLVATLRETLRQAEGWYDECRDADASGLEWHKAAVAALAAAGEVQS